MSFRESVEKLAPAVKALVSKATANGTTLIGNTDKDKAEVSGWIGKVAQGDIVQESNLMVRLNSWMCSKLSDCSSRA